MPSPAPEQHVLGAGGQLLLSSHEAGGGKDKAAEPTAGGGGLAALSERFQAVPQGVESSWFVLCAPL